MTQNDNLQNSFDDEVTNAATENADSTTNAQESAFKGAPTPGTYSGYGQSAPVQPAYSPDSGYSQSYSPPYQQPAQPQPQAAYRPSPYDAPAGGSPYAQPGTRGDYQAPPPQGYAYGQQPYAYVQQPSYAPPAEAPAAKAKKVPKPGRPLISLGAFLLLAICLVGGLLLAWIGVYSLPTEPLIWANIDPAAPHTLPLSFGSPIFNDTHTVSFTSPFVSQCLRLYADNPSSFLIFFAIACAVIGLLLIFTILFLAWAKRPRFSIVVVILSLIALVGLLLSGGLALGNWIFGAILAAAPLLVLLGGLLNLPFRKRHLAGED